MLDQLPPEVILIIYRYLDLEDLKSIRETCKKLYECSLKRSIIENEILYIDKRIDKKDGLQILRSLRKTNRKYSHLHMSNINYCGFSWIFIKFGDWIKSVIFEECTVNFCQFVRLVQYLPNLEELSIKSCTDLFLDNSILYSKPLDLDIHLGRIRKLEITHTNYLTDESLCKFFRLCPNIEYLSIERVSLCIHQGVFDFNYRSTTDVLSSPSANVLTINCVKLLIESRCNSIRGLNLSNTLINNIWLSELFQIEGLRLERLILQNCYELRTNDLIGFGFWQCDLIELQVPCCRLISNQFLWHISVSMPRLKVLNISGNQSIDDTGIQNLAELKNIFELDISNCKRISSTKINETITQHLAKNIKILKMRETSINDSDFINIVFNTQLIEIDVSYCEHLTNYSLYAIFISQKYLQKLCLSLTKIDDEGLTGLNISERVMTEDFKKYRGQNLLLDSIQENLMSESLHYYNSTLSFGRALYCVEDLSSLTSLDLKGCEMITDHSSIPMRLPNLKVLNLSGCHELSSLGLIVLSYNCPSLENLHLDETNIDDVGISVLVRKAFHLRKLYLQKCLMLTNISLELIYKYCKRLRILNINLCTNMSEGSLWAVKNMRSVIKVIGEPAQPTEQPFFIPISPPLPT